MTRLRGALQEWLSLRRRAREEFEFHLDRMTVEYEALGVSRRAARRSARRRMGGRGFRKEARRELEADWRGLLRLLTAYGVPATPLFQPALLAVGVLTLLAICPSARLTIESVVGVPLARADRESVVLSREARNRSLRGITPEDAGVIRTFHGFSAVESIKNGHMRARLRAGASVSSVEKELRARAGSTNLRVTRLIDRSAVVMAPAHVVWAALLLTGVYRMRGKFGGWRSAAFLCLGLASHAVASLALWAVVMQFWLRVGWATDGRAALAFVGVLLAYVGFSVAQLHWWAGDARSRCPRCFAKLRMAMTSGTDHNPLLDCATTESHCIFGHGALQRDCWNERFRSNRSYWEGLSRA